MTKLTPQEFLKKYYPAGLPVANHQWESDMPEVMELYAQHLDQAAWVSVEERLPEEIPKKQVSKLVMTSADGMINVDRYDFERNRWFSHYGGITHWRTLPSLPQK